VRQGVFIGCIWFCAALSGCGGGSGTDRTVWDNLEETKRQNVDLSLQVQALEEENRSLKQQVQTLTGLDSQARLEQLDTLTAIRLHKRTGLYDLNEDGTCESLIVYLQTMDLQQDQVKTAGRCTIELWDLDRPAEKAKLAEWTLSADELQKTWGGTIFSQYYRIVLPLDTAVAEGTDLTVKAAFTDLLTGKVLKDQSSFRR
jgi:hypothetical protein